MATMRCELARRHLAPGEDPTWTTATYPYPSAVDERELVPTTERLLWRRNGALAYPVGKAHPVTEEPTLITETEYVGR